MSTNYNTPNAPVASLMWGPIEVMRPVNPMRDVSGLSGAKKNRSYTKKGPGRMPYNKGNPKQRNIAR